MSWTTHWSVAVLVIVSVKHGDSAGCPENVLKSASDCFPTYLSDAMVNNFAAIEQHCQNGMFEKSLTCLARVEASCHGNQDTLLLLRSVMDVKRWKASLDDLCTKVHVLQASSSCWANTSQRSAQCIQAEMLELQQRLMTKTSSSRTARSSSSSLSSSSSSSSSSSYSLSAASMSGSSGTVEEALDNLKHYCNTSKGILDCFQPLLHELCSEEASRLLEGMYLAFQPPLCDTKVTSPDHDDTDSDDDTNSDDDTDPDQGGRASHMSSSVILFMSCAILSVAVLPAGFF